MKNYEKYENYKILHAKLKKALNAEFYLEATLIIYAIIEDRTNSILISLGVFREDKYKFLATKIRKIENMRVSNKSLLRIIREELLNNTKKWREKRNKIIHNLAKFDYNDEFIKEVAFEGAQLVKEFSSVARKTKAKFQK